MGRELKRVPLNFKWPLHEVWGGYLRPYGERVGPPTGDGYQLWETTSEGSPISPVFVTLNELCEWCEHNATTFGPFKATAEEWKSMLSDGVVSHREGNLIFV